MRLSTTWRQRSLPVDVAVAAESPVDVAAALVGVPCGSLPWPT
jgi:hypothetical protein